MKCLSVFFVIVLFCSVITAQTKDDVIEPSNRYCLSKDDNPYLLFGTKTPYDAVRQNGGSATDCEPIQMWILSRHGTRNADVNDIKNMKPAIDLQKLIIKNYESGSLTGGLCPEDLASLRNWKWDQEAETKPDYLNEQGWKDIYNTARRYKMRYPNLLQTKYDSTDFYFRHTLFQRTQQSCYAFVDALFGDGAHEWVKIETPMKNDTDIRPYDNCPIWNTIDDEDDPLNKKAIFQTTKPFQKLLRRISKRLGFKSTLHVNNITSMYDNCRYDKSRYIDRVSPWCSVFRKWDLVLLEYQSDLSRYYKSSYGYEHNKEMGCFPLRHMRKTFEKTVINNGVAKPKTVAMFSHDTMLDMVYTALNFNKDQQEMHSINYEDLIINRRYSGSTTNAFGSNIVAVLHDCKLDSDRYKVQFFNNEKPMQLPGCTDGLCNWDYLRNELAFTERCSLEFCFKNETVINS